MEVYPKLVKSGGNAAFYITLQERRLKSLKVNKAYEITDAKIQFVSLVDKAANLKRFLITKAQDGQASFSTYGKIIAKDAEHHFATGIVYEPLAEDAHGNYMTEEEITKAAYYFAKSGMKVDLQHSFEPLSGVEVVESWVAKADFSIDGTPVTKGTWLMTVELADESLWDAIEKGEITGFSMGGVGNYSTEDVDLDSVEKTAATEKKGLFKKLAEMFGFDVVEKGAMADLFAERNRSQQFWTAFYALEDVLWHYDGYSGKEILETDEDKVRTALEDFGQIITAILTSGSPILKTIATAQPVRKAGKKMSSKNRETLQGIYDSLGAFLGEFEEPKPEDEDDEDKEDKEVTKAEVEKLVQESVAASVAKALGEQKPAAGAETPEAVTPDVIAKMVEEAVAKALTPESQEEPVTAESVAKMVEAAVAKAVEPVLKARGVPSALNDGAGGDPVEKSEHYLHGIL